MLFELQKGDEMKGPSIVVKGARAHNLKGVDIELPKNKLIVMTGLSGSNLR